MSMVACSSSVLAHFICALKATTDKDEKPWTTASQERSRTRSTTHSPTMFKSSKCAYMMRLKSVQFTTPPNTDTRLRLTVTSESLPDFRTYSPKRSPLDTDKRAASSVLLARVSRSCITFSSSLTIVEGARSMELLRGPM